MTATFDGLGFEIMYPENWQVTDVELEAWPRSVTLKNPEGAFWCVFLYPDDLDMTEVTDELVSAMRADYGELEMTSVCEQVGDQEATGYDLHFYCLDLLVCTRIRHIRLADQPCLLMCQAEDRDFDKFDMVFRAITASIFRQPG